MLNMPEFFDQKELNFVLEKFRIYKETSAPATMMRVLNGLISARINNCRDVYPAWIHWDYVRGIFLMNDAYTDKGIEAIRNEYLNNYPHYPFQAWLAWYFGDDPSFILKNDEVFLRALYRQHMDDFTDLAKVRDISSVERESIRNFAIDASRIVVVVDCENVDPFAFAAAMNGLDEDVSGKIAKVILIEDRLESSAWKKIPQMVALDFESHEAVRIVGHKSLVDGTLNVCVCQEHYRDGVDSFFLCSSDSDFFVLVRNLPTARFFVLLEDGKCGRALLNALETNGVAYADMTRFYSGDGQSYKGRLLWNSVQEALQSGVNVNAMEAMQQAAVQARITLTEAEREAFVRKCIRKITLTVGEDGGLLLELGGTCDWATEHI